MEFFYQNDEDNYKFFRMPKELLTGKMYAGLSLTAKFLYSVLLDRISLSKRNGWIDDYGRIYIVYPVSEISDILRVSKTTVVKNLKDLENAGLMARKRRGLGLPDLLYLCKFEIEDKEEEQSQNAENMPHCEGGYKHDNGNESCDFQILKKCSSGSEIACTVDSKRKAFKHKSFKNNTSVVANYSPLYNNTEYNNTNNSEYSTSSSLSNYTVEDTANAYLDIIKDNIEYDDLLLSHEGQKGIIDGIVDLIHEIVCMNDGFSKYVLIARKELPVSVVKSKFLKLKYNHIDYVLNCIEDVRSEIRNIKKYLLAALYNASSTMNAYYNSKANLSCFNFATS